MGSVLQAGAHGWREAEFSGPKDELWSTALREPSTALVKTVVLLTLGDYCFILKRKESMFLTK